jgi:hypothetical protein
MTVARSGSAALAVAACLIAASFIVTRGRAPTPWPDAQLYASIARSLQIDGSGVPSTTWFSPSAVDHLPFYGPVFFTLMSWSFTVFGFSIESSKLPGLLGVLLVGAGAAWLTWSLGGGRMRWLLAVVMIWLTPEIGAAATSGDMETLAAGLQVMALAAFARGFLVPERWATAGSIAGGSLLLAALTTPRTYPFVAAFFVCACVTAFMTRRKGAFRPAIAAGVVFTIGFVLWTLVEHGGPVSWARSMLFILAREDTDVATLQTATRVLAFNWSSVATPAAALAGGVLGFLHLVRNVRRDDAQAVAALFALATTMATGVMVAWGMNITFSLGMYFAIPVFAVVLALPRRALGLPVPALVAVVAVVAAVNLAVAGVRVLRIAATWEARDPAPLTEFIRHQVPPGSSVVGPNALYFFAVERAGSRYRSFIASSHADWARWATRFEAFAPPAHRGGVSPESSRFFIWQAGDEVPGEYACAVRVAGYVAPRHDLQVLGALGESWDVGFPSTDLYQLPRDCPVGYDPTGARTE